MCSELVTATTIYSQPHKLLTLWKCWEIRLPYKKLLRTPMGVQMHVQLSCTHGSTFKDIRTKNTPIACPRYTVFPASALWGLCPVAEDSLSMAHCKPFKKNKAKFFSRACLENLHRRKLHWKSSLYSHKASKIKGLRGVQKFSPIQPEQMFGARYDPHIPWSPIFQMKSPLTPVISTLLTVIHLPKHYVIPRHQMKKPCEPQ